MRRETVANVIAPALEVERAGGTKVQLEDLRGRVVLVHFWATWCPPCRQELPSLLETAGELRRDGRFEVLAVSVDDDWPKLRAFFPGAMPDAVVRMLTPAAQRKYGTSTLPDTYLVGPDGRLVERFVGAQDWRDVTLRAHLAGVIVGAPFVP